MSQSLTNEQVEVLDPIACMVATTTLRRVGDGLGWTDLVQTALMWAVQHPQKTAEYLGHEDEKQAHKLLFTAMANEAMRATQRERAARHGYKVYDLAYYSLGQLRDELLPAAFDKEAWTNPPQAEQSEGGRGASLPNERGGWITLLADVADAFRSLSKEQKEIVFLKYAGDRTVVDVADHLGLTEDVCEKRLERAVKAIHHKLGGDRPESCSQDCECRGVSAGNRRAMTNAAMLAATE